MKIEVDWDGCISSGMCTAVASDVFALDDKSRLILLKEGELDEQLMDQAVDAVDVCPVQAIRLVGERS